ncbi:MAG: zinc dependent phospholipase C family protein [Candidatus Diapherotrites archaeon]|nr:zinc dependent phospholipase C family protein [Candidatus Diapherotrites archaeon]
MLTHEWIANLVLKKISKRNFISKYENIDDYFFGAIAPDIRYINNTPREITHKPLGEKSIFEALKASSTSMPFMAGYETHLVVDTIWANDNNSMSKSIYENYGVNPNNTVHKLALYLAVDDYFQGEADWFFQFQCAGNISRANDTSVLRQLGYSQSDIQLYRAGTALYMREPGIDTLSFSPSHVEESLIKQLIDKNNNLSSYLKEFKKTAIETCLQTLERYLWG